MACRGRSVPLLQGGLGYGRELWAGDARLDEHDVQGSIMILERRTQRVVQGCICEATMSMPMRYLVQLWVLQGTALGLDAVT